MQRTLVLLFLNFFVVKINHDDLSVNTFLSHERRSLQSVNVVTRSSPICVLCFVSQLRRVQRSLSW